MGDRCKGLGYRLDLHPPRHSRHLGGDRGGGDRLHHALGHLRLREERKGLLFGPLVRHQLHLDGGVRDCGGVGDSGIGDNIPLYHEHLPRLSQPPLDEKEDAESEPPLRALLPGASATHRNPALGDNAQILLRCWLCG